MKIEIAVENLRKAKTVFDKHNVSFWLDHGTLLGAIRDGKIIEWDTDIDLAAWHNDATHFVSTFLELKKKGFNVVLNRKRAVMTIKRRGHNINVVFYRRRRDYAWSVFMVPKRERIRNILTRCVNLSNLRTDMKREGMFARRIVHFSSLLPPALKQLVTDTAWLVLHRLGCMIPIVVPKRYFERLLTIQFYEMEINAPFDVENYLEYRYGSDWKTPTKKWVYYKDDGALAPNWDWLCMHASA